MMLLVLVSGLSDLSHFLTKKKKQKTQGRTVMKNIIYLEVLRKGRKKLRKSERIKNMHPMVSMGF